MAGTVSGCARPTRPIRYGSRGPTRITAFPRSPPTAGRWHTWARGGSVFPLNGGTPRVAFPGEHFGTVVGWTDNGHIVAPVTGGLVRVSTAGGVAQPFMTLDTAAGDLFPVEVSGLPNGGAVFSIVGTDTSNIAVVGPDGGKPTRLLTGLRAAFAPPGYLIVTRADGSIVAVPFDPGRRRITGAPVSLVSGLRTGAFTTVGSAAVSATGRLIYLAAGGAFADPRDLVWVSRSGAVAPAAPGWAGLFMSVALSPDGRRAAVDEFRENDEVLSVRDLSSGSVAHVAVPLMQLNDPVFSPDGRWVYFAAARGVPSGPGRPFATGARDRARWRSNRPRRPTGASCTTRRRSPGAARSFAMRYPAGRWMPR